MSWKITEQDCRQSFAFTFIIFVIAIIIAGRIRNTEFAKEQKEEI
ncbi:hypothetical protein [Kineothrix alysoides]|nr:hypothetical protein [Kineothrix alysoides]